MSFKRYSVLVYSILLFFCSAVAVFLIFPKEKQFAYNFSIGSPWLHDDLIATSDFPVYKTDEELQSEKDSIIRTFVPYYVNDTSVAFKYRNAIKREIKSIEDDKLVNLALSEGIPLFTVEKYIRDLKDFGFSLDTLLTSYYKQGVISFPDSVKKTTAFQFYLYNNGISELSYGYEYISTKQLTEAIEKLYSDFDINAVDTATGFAIKSMIKTNIVSIPSNIIFNVQLNKQVIDSKTSEISPVSGMVKQGELIIRKGNIVGPSENRILLSLKRNVESDSKGISNFLVSSGSALIFLALYVVLFIYLLTFHSHVVFSFKDNTFLTLQMMLMIFAVYFVFAHTDFNINVIPFALFPLLILTFYNFQISFIIYLASLLIVGFFAPNSFEFVFIQTLTGLVAMFSLKKNFKRRQIFITVLFVFVTYVIITSGFLLIKQGTFNQEFLKEFSIYGISAFLILLYLPFVFIFEKSFGFISGYTLIELSDTNNPALRLLAEKAPGTFQHSVQVANLVESVVRELGGDYLLARTGALYHDIGKSHHPEYFIENQSGNNVHDQFDFEESAQKIISHVEMGAELARKYNLPKQVADFVTMHHGTSLTKYFFNSWINANPDQIPVISNFKYPGPKPQSLETAVMMMADAVEAASRTLGNYTAESIENTVNKIIDNQLADGQFEDVDITLKQLTVAKKVFSSKIKNIYHARVIYPEINKKN